MYKNLESTSNICTFYSPSWRVVLNKLYRWWFHIFFDVHLYFPGRWTQFDEHIFFKWVVKNHQPENQQLIKSFMTDLPTRNHWNPCDPWGKCKASIALERKAHQVAKEAVDEGWLQTAWSAVSYGFAALKNVWLRNIRNHTKWGTWKFEITMTFGHVGHLEVWNRGHLGTRLILEQVPAPSENFIWKKNGPNGGWKTGACAGEALSVKGYVVNQYFVIFLGASFNKLLRIQAMFPPQTSLQ